MTSGIKPKPVLITGVWRSGTSLLQALLNHHPRMGVMFEVEPYGLFRLQPDALWPDDWAARLEFFNQSLSRHRINAAVLPKKVNGRECMAAFFSQFTAGKDVAVMSSKSPSYHAWLPQIAAAFPQTEFIVVWRNPLDCCRSVLRAGRANHFFAQRGILNQTLFGQELMARGVEKLLRAGRRVHQLTYADLVADPEKELRRICDFVGLKFDPVMLDLRTADFSMVPPGEHHAPVRYGKVVKDLRRMEVLPEEFIAKGNRYAALWKERFAGLKFAQTLHVPPGQSRPDEAERIGDQLAYVFWKSVGRIKRFMFRNVPLGVWARLRRWNRRMRLMRTTAANPVAGRPLTFSIVTPSFRNSNWLKLCIASVADQRDVELEHIVQDSCSDDGTADWLPHDARVKAFIEKDKGMYDAVNRGYRRATGDILAYLNCDEQYLPGALKAVREFFEANPEVEVVLAGTIVTDGEGKYMCHRHSMAPHPQHIWFRFPVLTSSVFIRRKVIQERGIFFDTKWRDLGDIHWVLALMKHDVPMKVCDTFTSIFADTGDNMNMKPNAIREKAETAAMTPRWVQQLKPVWVVHHRLRRLAARHFSLKPTEYSIYTSQSPGQRVTIDVPKPTAVWWNRL